MKLSIMQPYFFPYLGYFALIKHTDHFVLFDTPQFIRHGWIERNRILNSKDGWQYIKVPLVKHERSTNIKDIKIRNDENWWGKIFAQLTHYKKKAPFYKDIIEVLKTISAYQTDSITKLNAYSLKTICDYLNISFAYSIFSEMNLNIDEVNEPDEWALEISKALGATAYYNPPGGKKFFDKDKYEKQNIELKFLDIKLNEYDQKRTSFEPGLSIIDVMMFNSKNTINEMLCDYEFV